MGLFQNPYKEITDEEAFRNAQPRKGVAGFFETIGDYFSALIKANLFTLGCLIPASLLYLIARMLTRDIMIVFLITLLGSLPAGAGLCGLNAVVCESIRNRGFVFNQVFKRNFRENLFRGILPGMLYIFSLVCTLYILTFAGTLSANKGGAISCAMLCILVASTRLILSYMLPMMTLVELPLRHYIRNSMLIIPACPKASLGILLVNSIFYLLTVLFLPYTGIYVALLAFALHTLIGQLWSWPALNKTLRIEERENTKKHEGD